MIDLANILRLQEEATAAWQSGDVCNPHTGLPGLVCAQHGYNFRLWKQEELAHRPGADDHEVAEAKRAINELNNRRNEWIEKIDDWIAASLASAGVACKQPARLSTETPGSAIDRISILALRIYYLEQLARKNVPPDEPASPVAAKLEIARRQRADLADALAQLLDDIYSGRIRHRPCRALKMYRGA